MPASSRFLVLLVTLVALGGAGAGPVSADGVATTAVRWATAQAGTHESGSSNCSPTIDRWTRHMDLRAPPCRPWCGAFVHEAFLRAGVRLSPRLIDPARSAADAAAGRRGLKAISVSRVRPGDLLFFALHDGSPAASHIAIVTTKPRHGMVRTIEGNVSNAVRRKTRGLAYALLAARVVR